MLDEQGATVVAISDVNGAMYDPAGIDTATVPSHDEEPEAVTEYADTVISNDELLTLDVDVLIPAALGNVITEANADDIAAEYVVEGANGPTTSTADSILADRDVMVIPDILANAGGVTVSYFEWLQDINRRSWSLERVNDELDEEMRAAWDAVRTEFENRDITWRDAAYIVALSRIAEAHEARGSGRSTGSVGSITGSTTVDAEKPRPPLPSVAELELCPASSALRHTDGPAVRFGDVRHD